RGCAVMYRLQMDSPVVPYTTLFRADETLEILAQLKIPTTRNDPHGVAAGVIQAVQGVLERGGIDPAEVVFISHGTTQATNALLEGDVVPVGIVGMGSGLDGARARNQKIGRAHV